MNPSAQIDNHIKKLAGWRGHTMGRLRRLIGDADPDLVEEWKWNTPIWSHKGNVVAVGAFKDHVKVNFFKGASLDDRHGFFNAGLEAKASRSIDIHEGDKINEDALTDLVRAAVVLNRGKSASKAHQKRKKPKQA